MKIPEYVALKGKRSSSWVTCYDYSSARILSQSPIDGVLVGDSGVMVMQGFPDTLSANLQVMMIMTQSVRRGLGNKSSKLIIADIPFPVGHSGWRELLNASAKLLQSGAQGVKLEGAGPVVKMVEKLVQAGIPVMGHLGLTPQSYHKLGGYRVQGRALAAQEQMLLDALALEKAGCFALVLECIPWRLAKMITERLNIPVIGIGAGPYTDGQILVWQDVLGMNLDFQPRFVRPYADLKKMIAEALSKYHDDVVTKKFPSLQESFGDEDESAP